MADRSGSINIKGLRETIRSLEKLGTEVKDLKDVFRSIGNMVVEEAQSRAPKLSGALAGSIKASNTKNKSIVRAGSARVPYAGVQEWGWPKHNIAGTRYLSSAVEDKQKDVVRALDKELSGLIRRLDLN